MQPARAVAWHEERARGSHSTPAVSQEPQQISALTECSAEEHGLLDVVGALVCFVCLFENLREEGFARLRRSLAGMAGAVTLDIWTVKVLGREDLNKSLLCVLSVPMSKHTAEEFNERSETLPSGWGFIPKMDTFGSSSPCSGCTSPSDCQAMSGYCGAPDITEPHLSGPLRAGRHRHLAFCPEPRLSRKCWCRDPPVATHLG